MQLHPLLNNFGGSPSNTPTSSTSSSSFSSVANFLANNLTMPNGLPSGLSVTITPAPSNSGIGGQSQHSHGIGYLGSSGSTSNTSVTITKANTNSGGAGQGQTGTLSIASSLGLDISCSPPPSNLGTAQPDLSGLGATATFQQQQQLRALAASLQSVSSLNLSNMGNITNSSNTAALNQASLAAAASKLIELNPMDDIVMQEVTQRLFKMNQELWQQAGVSSAAGAMSSGSSPSQGGIRSENNTNANGMTNSRGTSTVNFADQMQNQLQQQLQQQQHRGESVSLNTSEVNEMKIAEKLVNELAVQQSTRNAFHLNERTLQECWNTLQRVSCMIFMHKSAMQLQQQQQQQAAAYGVHHVNVLPTIPGLIRTGSASPNSENGGHSKPHQCHQCLKSFSSNHQLVQHIRVHTGEKPYKCSYCDRRFKQLSHVQQHTRLHTGERPYKCHVQDCGRAFIQLSNLQQHLRNHDAQLERSKNRPFHCNICGKGFATESSLRTHTTKQHAALLGGPNAVTCPVCHKLFLGGEPLMEHMKHTHKDPNASGVATKRRNANHPCPICGKHYVNEGSLRKHLTSHPETAQLTTSLRMWPCSVCQAVFTHETGLLTHMEQMRMDPKHQFAAQYMLSRAAAERREHENVLTAAAVAAMTGNNLFGANSQGQPLQHSSISSFMLPSPSGSESSSRLSSPLDTNSVLSSASNLQHTRMSSPVNGPLDARISAGNISNHLNSNHQAGDSAGPFGRKSDLQQYGQGHGARDKYESYEKLSTTHHHNHHLENNVAFINSRYHANNPHSQQRIENGASSNKIPRAAEQAAMKMVALLGQGHGHGHGGSSHNSDLRNFIQHQAANSQLHGQDMMSTIKADALLRSQAEALRIAVSNSGGGAGASQYASNGSNSGADNSLENQLNLSLAHAQAQQQQHLLRQQVGNPNLLNGHSNFSMHHPLNSILSQPDLSEVLLRQLDANKNLAASLTTKAVQQDVRTMCA